MVNIIKSFFKRKQQLKSRLLIVPLFLITLMFLSTTLAFAQTQDNTDPIFTRTPPPTVDYESGTSDFWLVWQGRDDNPENYVITKDGVEIKNGTFINDASIVVNVGDLSIGEYHYVCILYDEVGNDAMSNVDVVIIDTTSPSIDHPDDISYLVGQTGYNITWNPLDFNPRDYVIFKNGIEMESGPWNGSSIIVDVDGLSPGTYTYTCRVSDIHYNWIYDEVTVTVIDGQIALTDPLDQEVIFGPGYPCIFNFTFIYETVDTIELLINGNSFGDVLNATHLLNNITISQSDYPNYDGTVTVEIKGYQGAVEVGSHSRNYVFRKITAMFTEQFESGQEVVGDVLYLILHDPSGDNSFSKYTEKTKISLGVGLEITAGITQEFEVGVSLPLLLADFEASQKLTTSFEVSAGFDFRYEVTDTTELTSSKVTDDADYIGPGYGDRYWGEGWFLNWVILGRNITYFDGSTEYFEPQLLYGITRESEIFVSDSRAPDEWRALNPVHNGYSGVVWNAMGLVVDGGAPYTRTHEVTTTLGFKQSLAIKISSETSTKLKLKLPGDPYIGYKLTVSLGIKVYAEQMFAHTIENSYEIYDDETGDVICQDVGIDQRFGTHIFRTMPSTSLTSNPLEHNTIDYVAPVVGFPTINWDSNGDGLGPCVDDSPVVLVDISDEGGVQIAFVWFSINDGENWDNVLLTEQTTNPGTWKANIPSFEQGTTVLWYVEAVDNMGLKTTQKDPYGNPYSYIVINRAPTVTVTYPNGGEILKGKTNITWIASEPDGDSLTFEIAYNIENTGWHILAEGLTETSYEWDTSWFPVSFSVMIKVVANDGFGEETEDTSDYCFSIEESQGEEETNTSRGTVEIPRNIIYVALTTIGAVAGVMIVLGKYQLITKLFRI